MLLLLLCDEHSSESCHVKHIGSCIGDDIGCISLLACESGAAEDILLHEHCIGDIDLAVKVYVALSALCGSALCVKGTDNDIAEVYRLVL